MTDERGPWLTFLIEFSIPLLVGVVVALVTGIAVGLLVAVAAANDCSSGDMWCGLGAALLALAVGTLIAAISYTAAGVAIIRRCRRPGRRAAHITAHLAVPVALFALATLLSGL